MVGEPDERLIIRTTKITDPGDVLAWLPEPRALAWVQRGAGLAGWGEAAKVTLPAGPDRFAAGEKWLREVFDGADVRDEVGTLGSGPVAFGTFAFDPFSEGSVLVLPRVLIGRDGSGLAWQTTVSRAGEPAATPRPAPVRPPGQIRWHDGSLTAPQWQQAVAAAVRKITAGELSKVVLARDLFATAEERLDERALLLYLAERYPDCFTFACDGMLGATPELLIRRDGQQISSLVLAGTSPRGGTPEEDEALAAGLLKSAKNTEEHGYSIASVREALGPLCDELDAPDRPSLLRLPNLLHLGTMVHGTLAGDHSALAVVAALHPTAAVGGTPTETAVELIRELEVMDRARYAGPVGWMDANGNGEWGIALRSAQVTEDGARLFGGGGIVAGSDPATELAETQVKMRPMLSALEQFGR